MSIVQCAGVRLGVEQSGDGPPVILVHGAWSDRSTWDPVFTDLAQRFRIIRYDRRGYGESQCPGCTAAEHTADLLDLVRTSGLHRVTLVGNSLGGIIAIDAAFQAPEMVDRVIVHEPALLDVLEAAPEHRPLASKLRTAVRSSEEAFFAGNPRLAAQRYVEGVTSFPGAWQYLPEHLQNEFERHAPAFFGELDALHWSRISPAVLRGVERRLVITRGGRSSPFLRIIVERLWAMLPEARRHVFETAGHVPQQSCPADFVTFLCQAMQTV